MKQKQLYVFLFILVFSLPAFSQDDILKIDFGYVLPIDGDTIFGSKIGVSAKTIYLYEDKKKKGKWQKKQLQDYGYIIPDGRKVSSMFAATAFFVPTKQGAFLSGIDLDTTPCYLTGFPEHSNIVKAYFPDFTSRKLTTQDVHSIMYYDNEGKALWYDAIRLNLESYQIVDSDDYTSTITPTINEFSRRLADGKIQLHYAQLEDNSAKQSVYIVKKNYITTLLYVDNGLLTINTKNTLTELFEDYPALIEKIHTKGYESRHIPELVNEYNVYFEEQ